MSRYDLSREDLARLLEGEPRYRVAQIHDALFRRLADIDELTELPVALRSRLSERPELERALWVATEREADAGQTTKWLYRLGDGALIETVLMSSPRHSTVCVSSQAGCAMGCTFCATGDGGFTRQLAVGEILEQVVNAQRHARRRGARVSNVVFMGMGEPLANYPRVAAAVRALTAELGFGARHLTISTVGVVPGIRRLASEPLQVNLAVSLHAANDDLRDELVPLNRRYDLAQVLAACEHYRTMTRRRISLEWALIDRVNDRERDADELAGIARQLHAHVNLIPLNPTAGGLSRGLRGSPPQRVRTFRDQLVGLGVNVTVRRTRGREIDAACGQLAGSETVASSYHR